MTSRETIYYEFIMGWSGGMEVRTNELGLPPKHTKKDSIVYQIPSTAIC